MVQTASLAVLGFIGWLDYKTGYEFGFFIFYFIPVAISAWYCGTRDGIVASIASAVCWYYSDKWTQHPYSRAFFIYWEMFIRLISFMTTAATVAKIREQTIAQEEMAAELKDLRQRLAESAGMPLNPPDG